MTPDRSPRARKKRRSLQQRMEEASVVLLREALPRHWVIHDYAPDYGIDGTIELFDFVTPGGDTAEALGETCFFQLKSVKRASARAVALPSRYNVEKRASRKTGGERLTVEIVPFRLDTDELLTIEAMGAGVVVLLFLVCIESRRTFFVNITDLIDKVITPESPRWREQQSKVIYVPVLNELTPDTPLLALLRIYGARPKLMGLFVKIHFQWAELAFGRSELTQAEWHAMASHFTDALLRLDIWQHPSWTPLLMCRDRLRNLKVSLAATSPGDLNQGAVVELWFAMDAMSRTFEEIGREWGLPTWLGQSTSYP